MAGTYELPNLDFGNKMLIIEAAQPGTVLEWRGSEGAAIASTGTLILKNLTLRQHLDRRGRPEPLLQFDGALLGIVQCRIEQTSSYRRRSETGVLLSAGSTAKVRLTRSRFELPSSILLESRSHEVSVEIEGCLAFTPQLLRSRMGGTLRIRDSSIATHSLFHLEETSHPLVVDAANSYLQSRFTLLWLPELSDLKDVAGRIRWKGDANLYRSEWVMMHSENRSPDKQIPPSMPPNLHWPKHADWTNHWGTNERDGVVAPSTLVPEGMPPKLDRYYQEVHAAGVSVDPNHAGPFPKGE